MNFFLKILNEVRGARSMKVDGRSGARFIFAWDAKLRAYTYQPLNQDEVDDLFGTMGRTTSYVFAPVNGASPSMPEPAPIPPPPVPIEPAPVNPALKEQASHRGLTVTDADADSTAERLIAAYDKGTIDAINSRSMKTKR